MKLQICCSFSSCGLLQQLISFGIMDQINSMTSFSIIFAPLYRDFHI